MNLESALLEIERLQWELRKVVAVSESSRRKLNDMHKKYIALDREFVDCAKRNIHLEEMVASRPMDVQVFHHRVDTLTSEVAHWEQLWQDEKHAVNRLSKKLLEVQEKALKE